MVDNYDTIPSETHAHSPKAKSLNDWKNFLLEHKWMPKRQLVKKFGIANYDLDNFRRKPSVHAILYPWQVTLDQPPDRLRAILTQAWKYYITEEKGLNIEDSPRIWVPDLIAMKNVSRAESGFSFLTNSRYLKIVCPDQIAEARKMGITNVALAVHEFWPGRKRLSVAGVLPFMFLQTHRSTLDHLDATSMVEHVYLNYIAEEGALDTKETLMRAKEQLYARHDETGFLTQKQFERFGVPYNFYKQDGIRQILKTLAAKYADELGYAPTNNTHWSTSEFRKRFPDRDLRTCAYCGLRPIDLHHMVPRETHPNLAYESENVVPLCVQAHGYISRAHWTRDEERLYAKSIKEWLAAPPGSSRMDLFKVVMEQIHATIYGRVSSPRA